MQLPPAPHKLWKLHLKRFQLSTDKPFCSEHHLMRNSRMLTLEKLTAKEIYIILITLGNCKRYSQVYFDNLLKNSRLTWNEIYVLPHMVIVNSYLR